MKQAKIALTADIRGFKKQIDESKKALEGLGKVNISNEASKKLQNMFSAQLMRRAQEFETQIDGINSALEKMGKGDAFDDKKVRKMVSALGVLEQKLRTIRDMQKSGEGGEGGGMPSSGGIMGKVGGFFKSGLTKLAGFASAGALVHRRSEMADDRLRLRALTGGEIGSEVSHLGFTPAEIRARQIGIAGSLGRNVGGGELNSLTSMGEQAQRAYGITSEQQSGAMHAARVSGNDAGKYFSNSIGAAVAAKLEGSKIGEFLQASTSYLEQMSDGVDIKSDSLNGFAASLSALPFFKNDPNRAFGAMRSLNDTFQHGDRFQQAQSARAMLAGNPGADISAMSFRKDMGLFGKLDDETMTGLKKQGVDTKTLGMGGPQIIQNIFDDIMKSTKGMNGNDRLMEFKNRTGLSSGAAASIFAKGGKVSQKEFENATMSPEEQLKKTYENADGHIKDLTSTVQQLVDVMADRIAEPLGGLAQSMEGLTKYLGISKESALSAAGNVGATGVAAATNPYAGAGFLGDMANKGVNAVAGPGGFMDAGYSRIKGWMRGGGSSTAAGGAIPLPATGDAENTQATKENTSALHAVARAIGGGGGAGGHGGSRIPSNAHVISHGARPGKKR